ncbi:MAG: DUF4145 domain-containing protein [Nitrospina sp.]|jgi:hypothetical protein|nr:DUF4145 domain-containing protein [Nitrospina sp.]
MEHVPPKFKSTGFNCPFCNAFAHQEWKSVFTDTTSYAFISEFELSQCVRCNSMSIWVRKKLAFPSYSIAPIAAVDMPDQIKAVFDEARAIVATSPKGAAALLRLAIQELCDSLLKTSGSNLNQAIGDLVKQGMPKKVQQALDLVRVIGNNAVHPGQIDFNDNNDIALKLFGLVNAIVNIMITQPKEIDDLYNVLPKIARESIEKRDVSK